MTILEAVVVGMLVMIAGTVPRNIAFAANLRYWQTVPWAVPATAIYLWFFWRYLRGDGPPLSTSDWRRSSLRAKRVSTTTWVWALVAGALGIVTLVLALRVANRMVVLPHQELPNLSPLPRWVVLSLLLMAAPVAGIVEEAAFRGYMQTPLERRHGLFAAILITGTMFAIAHLDFTLILWPYYVAVAAIYGIITSLADSILPAVVLHTAGNVYSNLQLWLYGQAEWGASSAPGALIWQSGADLSFWISCVALVIAAAFTAWSFVALFRITREQQGFQRSG